MIQCSTRRSGLADNLYHVLRVGWAGYRGRRRSTTRSGSRERSVKGEETEAGKKKLEQGNE